MPSVTSSSGRTATAVRPGPPSEVVPWKGQLIAKSKLPLQLTNGFAEQAFADVVPYGAFAWDTLAEWRSMTAQAMSEAYAAVASITDERLRLQEVNFIDKMAVCWRVKGLGSLLMPNELIVRNAAQARELTPYLRRYGLQLIKLLSATQPSALAQLYWLSTIPVNRGKGSPYWLPGSLAGAEFAFYKIARQATTVTELDELLMRAGNAVMRPSISLYSRLQSAKAQRPAAVKHGNVVLPSDVLVWLCKIRKIQALPFAYNIEFAGPLAVIMAAVKSLDDRNTGSIDAAMRLGRTYRFAVARDLETYDDTVSIETLDALREYVTNPCLRLLRRAGLPIRTEYLSELDDHINRLPMLGPSWDTGWGGALIKKEGGITSGKRATSYEGTVINRCRCDAKLAAMDASAYCVNQGDDTLIFSNAASAGDDWDRTPSLGFRETAGIDRSLLMRRIPEGHSYYGRMLIACIQREVPSEPRDYVTAAAGIAVRQALLRGPANGTAHPLADAFLPALRRLGGRLAIAAQIATDVSMDDLLRSLAVQAATRNDQQQLDELIGHALFSSVLSETTGRALLTLNRALHGRSHRSIREIAVGSASMTLGDAFAFVRDHSYTQRR